MRMRNSVVIQHLIFRSYLKLFNGFTFSIDFPQITKDLTSEHTGFMLFTPSDLRSQISDRGLLFSTLFLRLILRSASENRSLSLTWFGPRVPFPKPQKQRGLDAMQIEGSGMWLRCGIELWHFLAGWHWSLYRTLISSFEKME